MSLKRGRRRKRRGKRKKEDEEEELRRADSSPIPNITWSPSTALVSPPPAPSDSREFGLANVFFSVALAGAVPGIAPGTPMEIMLKNDRRERAR